MKPIRYVFLGAFLVLLGLWAVAVTVPNAFQEGDVVSSSKVNENFQALADAVSALEAKLSEVAAAQKALPSQSGLLAYLRVTDDGTPVAPFNPSGGDVTVNKTGDGTYEVTFENLDLHNVMLITTTFSGFNELCRATRVANQDNVAQITCLDTGTQAAANASFYLAVIK